ncbi:MAG TPA: hypothetical protein VEC57_13990 [Candidatus Limnocylindrales bacterium]|nr:hypothetical protein [Candidatus Limnocylindrales bacterium]
MKKLIMPMAALALVGYAGTASAQCDFNVVAKAKGLKSSMIRAYAACPSTENPVVNTETSGGTPACEPVTPNKDEAGTGQGTEFLFDPAGKGGCSVSTSGKLVPDCATVTDSNDELLELPPGPCHIVYVKSKCKGIMQSDGTTPIGPDDSGWTLATLSRASLNDGNGTGNGDMTVIDFPVTFYFDDPSNGGLSLDANSAEALKPFVGPTGAALPTCTQIQVVDIMIKDPDGRPFAALGGGSASKSDLPEPQ